MTWRRDMIKLYRYMRGMFYGLYEEFYKNIPRSKKLTNIWNYSCDFDYFMIVYHSIKLKIYRQEILDLQNQINGIKTLPLQYRLGRVQSIAEKYARSS